MPRVLLVYCKHLFERDNPATIARAPDAISDRAIDRIVDDHSKSGRPSTKKPEYSSSIKPSVA